MADALPPLYDAGNALLEGVSSAIVVGTMLAADGRPRGIITVRTTSATVTVMLDPADVRTWADTLNGLHAQLGASSLIVPGPGAMGQLSALEQQARRTGNGRS